MSLTCRQSSLISVTLVPSPLISSVGEMLERKEMAASRRRERSRLDADDIVSPALGHRSQDFTTFEALDGLNKLHFNILANVFNFSWEIFSSF